MRVWSVQLGRWFGVEVRIHSFFLLLLVLFGGWAAYEGRPAARGAALWGLLLLSVLVREAARALVCAYSGRAVQTLLLLPTGGLLGFKNRAGDQAQSVRPPVGHRGLQLAGPLSNLALGLLAAGIALSVAPGVNLLGRPWVSPEHLLRALVWINLLLGVINLLPAWPLDGGQVTEGAAQLQKSGPRGMRANLALAIAIALVLLGLLSMNWWLIAAGITILLGAQSERQGVALERGADGVTVREVMLTEYSILSASATLEDAAGFSRHTLQDVFPVVRAGNMVGAVSRAEVMAALERNGNGYVQGIMTRNFETAVPGDRVAETLVRIAHATGASAQLVPVLEGEQIVGILTPGNLQRAMGLVAMSLRAEQRRASAAAEDEAD